MKPIFVHGHRGARARRPENTLPGFRYAIQQGVDAVELDCAVTKDHVVVVSHDPVINGSICRGLPPGTPIHSLTFEELRACDCGSIPNPFFPDQIPVPGAGIPTLDEVFALKEGNAVKFNVETKIFAERPELTPSPPVYSRLILELIEKHGLVERVSLQSFDPRTLWAMKKLKGSIPRGALFETACDWQATAREFEAMYIAPEFHLVTPVLVQRAHGAGLAAIPWTANEPSDWAALAGAGVDAIISDDPAGLIAWLTENGLR